MVYVSVQGPLYETSNEKGIYVSTDGGNSWQRSLFIDENTGASSLSMDPSNPRILYAGTWQHRRFPWKMESGGPGSGIHKSKDGGATWTKLTEGLPEVMGKVGVSVSPADPNRVYAVIEAEGEEAGVYRSDNGGEKWMQVSKDRITIARAWYYIEIEADPQDENTVYVLNSPLLKSVDGGKNFAPLPVPHIDVHDHWINPNDNKIMINGNDGGGAITFNGGETWSTQQNQPTAQFYRVVTDDRFPYYVYGGQQDNTSMAIASRTSFIGVGWKDWYQVAGGESAYLAFDPENPEVVYGTQIQGLITRYDVPNKRDKPIQVYPEKALGMIPKDMKYRFNWNPPLVWRPQNPNIMYFGAQKLLRTSDGGLSWEEISPDLTRNQLERQGPGGGPFTNEAAGGENYNTIMYIVPSPHQQGIIYVGTDDGLVHLTMDEGQNWKDITPDGLPEAIINCIEISPHDPSIAYMVAMRYKFGDFTPLIYKTTDYGTSWSLISEGIADDTFVRAVREDPETKGLLYAATEKGFYISNNQGDYWHRLDLNLPPVPITDITIKENDLVAATAGRGYWILDDIGALQQSKDGLPGEIHLYQPKATIRYSYTGFGGIRFPNHGTNPANGIYLDYYLPVQPDSSGLTLEILSGEKEIIRTYSSNKKEESRPAPVSSPPEPVLPVEIGINRFSWDFRNQSYPGVEDQYIGGSLGGYMIAPGTFHARLIHLGDTVSTTFEILPDPNWDITPEEFAQQQEMLASIDSYIIELHQSIASMRTAQSQLKQHQQMLKDQEKYQDLLIMGDSIMSGIQRWEQQLLQTKMKTQQDVVNFQPKLVDEFMFLKGYIDNHDPRLTTGAIERMQDLENNWKDQKATLDQLIEQDLQAYNTLYRTKEVPAIILRED
jgi:photosystem II stability/assembly factor-like uncharacterized protein